MKLKHIFLLLAFLSSGRVSAHGEDKAGPNGGVIRMPGAFHTEVVPIDSSKIRIYLLDVNFAKPTVQNSAVDVKFVGKQSTDAFCQKEISSYLCTFQNVDLRSKGEIVIKAFRDNLPGVPAKYPTPIEKRDERKGV